MSKIKYGKGKHPNTIAGLKPHYIKKGEIRNPLGKKGPKTIRSVLKELMQAPPEKHEYAKLPPHIPIMLEAQLGRKPTRQDLMALIMVTKAMDGDIFAFNAVLDRVDGKPLQVTENKNLDMNYVDFLKAKQQQLEGKNLYENQEEETELLEGQTVEYEDCDDDQV